MKSKTACLLPLDSFVEDGMHGLTVLLLLPSLRAILTVTLLSRGERAGETFIVHISPAQVPSTASQEQHSSSLRRLPSVIRPSPVVDHVAVASEDAVDPRETQWQA